MSLSDINLLKLIPTIPVSGEDSVLQSALDAAETAVKLYCKRDFESQSYTQYYSGQGHTALALLQRPVTTVTSVYLDPFGYFGKATGAFAASTLLTEGTDYVLSYDVTASRSDSGILLRIGGGAYGDWPWQPAIRGSLSERTPVVWPAGFGNVKVTYTAGFSTIPADLIQAVNQFAAWLYRNSPYGGMQAKSNGEMAKGRSFSLAMLQANADLGSIRQLLSAYREVSI